MCFTGYKLSRKMMIKIFSLLPHLISLNLKGKYVHYVHEVFFLFTFLLLSIKKSINNNLILLT